MENSLGQGLVARKKPLGGELGGFLLLGQSDLLKIGGRCGIIVNSERGYRRNNHESE